MSRNLTSRFDMAPQLSVPRSSFEISPTHTTSFNAGEVIPIFRAEIYPGDSLEVKTSYALRMPALITPMYGDLVIDTYFFFVPNRLLWKHWREFMGENTESAWVPQTVYSVPQIEAPEGGWNVGTLADYFGLPPLVDGIKESALPFRAYALIMQEFFRDENLTDPLVIPDGDSDVIGSNGGDYITDVALGGKPFIAAKLHDYFTSALPGAQKADLPVMVPLGESAPVFGNGLALGLRTGSTNRSLGVSPNISFGEGYSNHFFAPGPAGVSVGSSTPDTQSGTGAGTYIGVPTKAQLDDHPEYSGLYADIADVSGISVNTLRLAFAMQKILEKDARTGSRYIEIIKGHFGVSSPDARLQRPEYLGGHRQRVNINQVVQTSASDAVTPQGNVAGYSLTTDSHGDFLKSFVEHGFVIGLAVVRYYHLYQNGIERFWSRKDRFDYFWPAFSNIGEQMILNKEIFASGTSTDEEGFGFQEAWADLRQMPSRISGQMRSVANNSLDIWHLADDYSSLPSLSDAWIREDKSNLDRVLSVSSSVTNQFFADFFFDLKFVRCMPMYSVPGLIDHN